MCESICNRWVSILVQKQLEKDTERDLLEHRWLDLTRVTLPGLARKCTWPIFRDHCFQRVLLDAACGGCWYDRISGRPAYKAASGLILARAISIGERIISEPAYLPTLNRQSLQHRGKI